MQGVKGMTPLKYALGIIVIICLTIVFFTFINRGTLCELTIKSGFGIIGLLAKASA
jgi:hypothetical protein